MVEVKLGGEAYSITVDVKFPIPEFAGLDFGVLRVVDERQLQLLLVNTGKFPVNFKFTTKHASRRELFRFEPEEGQLEPLGGKVVPTTVKVSFIPNKTLRKEITIGGINEIQLHVVEPLTG